MEYVIAIDPGTTKSAIVVLDDQQTPVEKAILQNAEIVLMLRQRSDQLLAIEMIASYGMPVGESTFETVLWIGRFIEAHNGEHVKVYRKRKGECESVGMHLCKSTRAKDSNISQAVRDRYPATGGGKNPAVGTKSQPGPLYGFRSHMWQALAVGITAMETRGNFEVAS